MLSIKSCCPLAFLLCGQYVPLAGPLFSLVAVEEVLISGANIVCNAERSASSS